MKTLVVIPAYNEEKRISKVLNKLKQEKFPTLVVDDGSKDLTFYSAKDNCKYLLRHRVNLGKGSALKTGVEAAFTLGADAVVMMDADGQHNPADLKKFFNLLKKNKYDIIFGSRIFGTGTPLMRFLGNKIASIIINLLFGIYISDVICGYRAFTKKAYKKIKWQSSGYGVETEMVIKAALYKQSYCEVPIQSIYYDTVKGVTPLDALAILIDALKWRLSR